MAGECAGLVRDLRGLWAEWHAVSEAGLPDGVLPELLLRCRRATRPGPLSCISSGDGVLPELLLGWGGAEAWEGVASEPQDPSTSP